jgi:amyloid beta precursor protein binding protein 1
VVLSVFPLGTETLKNLVLPGVGFVKIFDELKVTERDLGNNFFVTEDRLGESRALVTKELLLELNPDSSGDHEECNLFELVTTRSDFTKDFTLVIAANIDDVNLINNY